MAELVDALASGASLSNWVQVQVLFRVPVYSYNFGINCAYSLDCKIQ